MGTYTKTGFKYFLGMHMIVGHRNMDAVEKINVGEKVVWLGQSLLKDSFTEPFVTDRVIALNNFSYPIWLAQTFTTATSYTITSVSLYIRKSSLSHPGTVTVSIHAVNGSGHPTGDALCFGTTNGETLTTSREWRNIAFDNPVILNSNTKYAMVVQTSAYSCMSGGNTASIDWGVDTDGGNYTGGNLEKSMDYGVTWAAYIGGEDGLFKTYTKYGAAPNHAIWIDAKNKFGGYHKEGGIKGKVNLLFGDSTQAQDLYLVSKLGSDIPAYRGFMSMVLRRMYVGVSPYLRPWSFFCKRTAKQISGEAQWYPSKAVIRPGVSSGDDLNPAHIIRECLIDNEWGAGWDAAADIDDVSFRASADILYSENFGLSLLWDQVQPIEDFIGNILKCIAGFLYQDLEIGKWILSLTREPTAVNKLQDYHNTGDNDSFSIESTLNRAAQLFAPTETYTVTSLKVKLSRAIDHDENGIITVSIQGVAGRKPDNNPLSSGTYLTTNVTTDADGAWYEIILDSPITLTKDTQYAIVINAIGVTGDRYILVRLDNERGYEKGYFSYSTNGGGLYNPLAYDAMFETYSRGELYSIESFDESDIMEIEDFIRPMYGEIIDQVVINWWDKIHNKPRVLPLSDIALIEKQGGKVIDIIHNHYGICNATLANLVGARELKIASSLLASMRIKATRKMAHLKPNSIFKLSWAKLGIVSMVVRVLEINYGSLNNNAIYLDCVEDVFSTSTTTWADPPDTLWATPANDPVDVTAAILVEVPYWLLCNEFYNRNIIDNYENDTGLILIAAVAPVSDAYGFAYLIQHVIGLDFKIKGNAGGWCPSMTITNDMYMESADTIIDVSDTEDIDYILDDCYAIIGNEIIRVIASDSDSRQITIARGILDTVPEAHLAGSRIYFIGAGYEGVEVAYTNGDQPKIKILTKTGGGVLDEADASTLTADALNSRMIRPYPPGNLKFNGESFPTFLSSAIEEGFVITWSHRDRTNITQLHSLVKHTDATDYGPEATTTYTIKVYDEDNNLIHTKDDLTTTDDEWEYTEAQERTDCSLGAEDPLNSQLRFVIYAVRDGYNSWNDGYDILIKRTFTGIIAATATASAAFPVITPLRSSSCVATTSATGHMHLVDLDGDIDGESATIGAFDLQTGLIAATTESAEIAGVLDSIPELIATTTAAATIAGTLTI